MRIFKCEPHLFNVTVSQMSRFYLLVLMLFTLIIQSISFCPFHGAVLTSPTIMSLDSDLWTYGKMNVFRVQRQSKLRFGIPLVVESARSIRHTLLSAGRQASIDEAAQDEGPFIDAAGVIGGGALRGEQDFYSMRDLQAMRVTRLKSMCEARFGHSISSNSRSSPFPPLSFFILPHSPTHSEPRAQTWGREPIRRVNFRAPRPRYSAGGSRRRGPSSSSSTASSPPPPMARPRARAPTGPPPPRPATRTRTRSTPPADAAGCLPGLSRSRLPPSRIRRGMRWFLMLLFRCWALCF